MEPTSRRMANLAYVLFTLAHACGTVASMAALEAALAALAPAAAAAHWPPAVAKDLNSAGLLAFLAANLLTGATNLAIDTLATPIPWAVAILMLYALAVAMAAKALARANERR